MEGGLMWTHIGSKCQQKACAVQGRWPQRDRHPQKCQIRTKRGFQSLASYDYGDDIQSCHTFEPRQRNIQKEIKYKQHHLA